MKKKFHFNWYYFICILVSALCLIPLINYGIASSDPAARNWRLDYLRPGEAVDAYLHSGETKIALAFSIIALIFFLAFLADLLLRKKASHIALVETSTLAVIAYEITRMVYCFQKGSVNIMVGITYCVALLGSIGCVYFYFKKALDGDNLWPYWVCFIVSAAAFFFAGATKDSYSILNAYSHFNASNHIGDFEYWMGYGASRLMFILLCFGCLVNLHFDFCPETEEKKNVI
ncbi:MAG: hypothetical protein PUE65_04990 [Mollicutes bacterium]|nr:hypothetical protein [Mollicutes bacterium]